MNDGWLPEIYIFLLVAIPILLYSVAVVFSKLESKRITEMTEDFSKLQDAVTALQGNVTSVTKEVEDLKATSPSNQAVIDAITANVTAASEALSGLVAKPVGLVVTPATINVMVGVTPADTITASGGTVPYTAAPTNGLAVTFVGGIGTVSGSTPTTGTTTFEVLDSSTPPQTATVTVVTA